MQQKNNLPAVSKTGIQIAKAADNSLSLINQLLEEGNPEYWYKKAVKAKECENWDSAFYFFSKAVQINNKENKYLIPKGYCAMKVSKTEIATNSLIQAFKHRTWNAYVSFMKLLTRKEWSELRTYFYTLNSHEYSISFTIALLEYSNNNLEKGLHILDSISNEQKKNRPDFYDLRGFLNQSFGELWSSDNLKSSKIDYDILINLEPNNASVYYDRGYTCYQLGCHKLECAQAWHWSRQKHEDKAFKHFKLAVSDLKTCIELNPKYERAYFIRGLAYYNLKEFELAINDYTIYIEFNPNNADGYFNRGSAYYALKEYSLAIADCTVVDACTEGLNLYAIKGKAASLLKDSNQKLEGLDDLVIHNLPIF